MIILILICTSVADLESLYVHEQYQEVITKTPFVLLDTALTDAEVIQANKLYAFSLVITERKDDAMMVFQRLLDLQPTITLDPIKVSPKIITVFNEAKAKKLLIMPVPTTITDTFYVKRKIPLTCIVPGVYQLQRSKGIKGITLLATGIASIAGLSLSHYYVNKTHHEYLDETDPQRIPEKYEVYNSWYKRRVFFISTSTVICLYNFIDVFRSSK